MLTHKATLDRKQVVSVFFQHGQAKQTEVSTMTELCLTWIEM